MNFVGWYNLGGWPLGCFRGSGIEKIRPRLNSCLKLRRAKYAHDRFVSGRKAPAWITDNHHDVGSDSPENIDKFGKCHMRGFVFAPEDVFGDLFRQTRRRRGKQRLEIEARVPGVFLTQSRPSVGRDLDARAMRQANS